MPDNQAQGAEFLILSGISVITWSKGDLGDKHTRQTEVTWKVSLGEGRGIREGKREERQSQRDRTVCLLKEMGVRAGVGRACLFFCLSFGFFLFF